MSDTPRADELMSMRRTDAEVREFCEKLERQLDETLGAISKFCKEQAWAAQSWKDQPHIKRLFEISSTNAEVRRGAKDLPTGG